MKRILFILLMSFMMFLPLAAFSQSASGGSGPNFVQKAEKKADSRWTLQGWMEQKERNKIMDLWLAMNSPSPYEFYIGGNYQDFLTKIEPARTEKHYTSGLFNVGAYSGIIGLEGFYEKSGDEDLSQSGGSLNLRIVGNAVQGTHLIVSYGYRSLKLSENSVMTTVNQAFAGGDINMYLTRSFGFSAAYRYYFPVDNAVVGSVSENRTEAGAFVDFSAVRISGSWYSDKMDLKPNQIPKAVERTGIFSGLKFFF